MARWLAALSIGLLAATPAMVGAAHEHGKLPPGPISDRHELMESQGQQAEAINTAFSVGSEGFDVSIIQRSAQAIAMSAHQIPDLFPKGSTDPNSRALPAIWTNWDKFVGLAKQLEDQASSLSNAASTGDTENLQEKSKKMFATCKACHDQFRKPKDDKKKAK
jgi:cytochrome c556